LLYDEVVLENPILKGFPVFDIDRVEVLRGPQGTLFGRNTPAGIVKFDTVRPGRGRSYAKVSYGSFNSVNAEARSAARSVRASAFACPACFSAAATGSTMSMRRARTTSRASPTMRYAGRSLAAE
jgi:outer membrane cobalamin receptor